MYEQKSNDDLQRFFDRYCKGTMNGWEQDTPPVRLSLLGCGSVPNIVERPEVEFPLHRQKLVPLYLDGQSKTLQASKPDSEHSVSYEGHSLDGTAVSYTIFLQLAFAKVHRISFSNSPSTQRLQVTPKFVCGCHAARKMTWMLSFKFER